MRKSAAALSLALLILVLFYSTELLIVRKRINREVTRMSGTLRRFQEENREAAKIFFAIPRFETLRTFPPRSPGANNRRLIPTLYSELGMPKISAFPPVSPLLQPLKTPLSGGKVFWLETRWIYAETSPAALKPAARRGNPRLRVLREGKLWVETLGSPERWPRSPEKAGSPIWGLAASIPNEFLHPQDPKMTLLFNAPSPRGLGRLLAAQVNLPDRNPSTPSETIRYKLGIWTHLFFLLMTWILVAAFLRLLKSRPTGARDRETQLEEELNYLSRTYQNLSKSLRVERQKVEAILNSAPDGIFTCSPEGIITFWNRSMESLTKLSKESAVGKHYRDIMNIFSAQGQLLADPFSLSFDQLKTLSLMDCQLEALGSPDSNGGSVTIPVALGAARVMTSEGPVEEIVVTVKDIRAQKEAEELRKDMQAMITHDLRSPLSAILGYAGLVQNAKICKNEEDARKYLDSLVRAGKEMLILISNLLGWSWMEAGKLSFHKESLQIAPIIKDTVDHLEVLAKPKNLSMVVGAPDDLWALTDGDKLKEILNNLITNAIKFSRPGGTIRVSVEEEDNSKVRISVADEGPGIPPEERDALFKKFSSLRKPGSGTGLGLYIVKTLAEALDGSVEVESEVGRGSRFSILLPAIQKIHARSKQLSFMPLMAAGKERE